MAITPTVGGSVRARARTRPAAAPTPEQLQPGASDDWMASGAQAIVAQEQHKEVIQQRREERAAEVKAPYRFWLAQGDEADLVILDSDFGPSLLEHNLTRHPTFRRNRPGTDKPEDIFVLSPQQWEPDPLIPIVGKDPYRVTFLTVRDMRPYTKSDGTTINSSYRLLPLMGEAFDEFVKIRAAQIAAGNSEHPLRGVQVVMSRSMDDRSPRTGLPTFVARHSEQDVLDTFGHAEVRAETDGRLLKAANAECYAVDYRAIFPKPSADEIRTRFNLGAASAPVGSSSYVQSEWGGAAGSTGTSGFQQSSGDIDQALSDDIPF